MSISRRHLHASANPDARLDNLACGNELALGFRDETQRFSPKRGASLPDYLIGGNPREFPGFEFDETALCRFEPEPLDVSV